MLPAVHAAPADFALGREPLAMLLGDVAGRGESFGDRLLALGCLRRPLVHAGSRIDPYDAGFANPDLTELLCDSAGLFDRGEKLLALFRRSHRRAASHRRPHRRNDRSYRKSEARDLVSQALDVVLRRIDRGMRIGKKKVDPFELGAACAGGGGQLEHGVEVDRRLRIRALAHESRPHGVMQFRVIVARHMFLPFAASGRSPNAHVHRRLRPARLSLSDTLVSSAEKEARLGGENKGRDQRLLMGGNTPLIRRLRRSHQIGSSTIARRRSHGWRDGYRDCLA